MNRFLSLGAALALLALLPGCPTRAVANLEPTCRTAGCPEGSMCVADVCEAVMTQADGGSICERDEDCPTGQACVRSTGACVVAEPTDAGTPELDAGVDADLCREGTTEPCGESKLGACRLGVRRCLAGDGGVFRFGACEGAVGPTAEVCNGLDDDCDGDVDEGFGTASCGQGTCVRTVNTCEAGVAQTCTPGAPTTETCNGLDDDCDGDVDEGQPMVSCGVGECRRTLASCASGVAQTCTAGTPVAERCNGLDDDCDGVADNGFGPITCGQGVCRQTVNSCVAGAPQTCTPLPAGTETCNQLDDDCDGTIDEGCACTPGASRACYSGPLGTQGVGRCAAGTQTCSSGGQWGTCANERLPLAETCNAVDDDCDAVTDEDLGLVACGVGACRRSVMACVNGAAQTCTPGAPTAELCNGLDDDCDNSVDDGLPNLTCGQGECARSVTACVAGVTQTCTPGMPQPEVCDGRDNDCDGSTDESFPQSGMSCSTGLAGPCGAGASRCMAGVLSCQQTVMPAAEVCGNGVDDNCNGIVDDGMGCCTNMADADLDGVMACNDCNDTDGAIRPGATELCDGKDNDCDGLTDEGFDADADGFTRCGTRVGGGVDPTRVDCNDMNAFVFPLKATDCGAAATPATPNAVDDNCNGLVDETCGCRNQDRDGDGVTDCQGDCNDNDATVAPGRPELCDGKDNDCNAATVQNCGVSQNCGRRQGPSWSPWPSGTDTCRADLVCVSNVATGELTCGSFCNQTTGTGLGDSCAASEGCLRNLVDSANLHLCSVLQVGGGATGSACALSSQCRSGDCLTTDGPTDYCTDKCTHEAGCSANTTCVVQESPLTSGPFTIGNYLWSSCRLDSNLTATRTKGQTCSASMPCRAGPAACHNGTCIEPCCDHSDCGAGFSCKRPGPQPHHGLPDLDDGAGAVGGAIVRRLKRDADDRADVRHLGRVPQRHLRRHARHLRRPVLQHHLVRGGDDVPAGRAEALDGADDAGAGLRVRADPRSHHSAVTDLTDRRRWRRRRCLPCRRLRSRRSSAFRRRSPHRPRIGTARAAPR
jgi:hypothetical protein